MKNSQINLFDEIIVDNFAGGGGASVGIELATGRPVAIAINHDPDAIALHKANHRYTRHLQASVWDVDPQEVCGGSPVGLAWFSPDCKHFSKAKGAALCDRNIRGLAWIVLRWAGTVRPRVVILENVEEFKTWGPVRRGKPVKKYAGKTFRQFITQLKGLDYNVEYRELIAADYGAPTTRKRLVLIARCDGKPIVWPKRTHAPRDSEEVKSGNLLPWRSAAEIIDWTLPGYSIFLSRKEIKERYGVYAQRPLKPNTLRRIIRGIDKFTIRSGCPFIAQQKFQNVPQGIMNPLSTVTSVGSHEVVVPLLASCTFSNTGGSIGGSAADPVHTIRTSGGQVLSAAHLIQYHSEQSKQVRGQGMSDPIMTVDSSNRYGLTGVNLIEYYGTGRPLSVESPLHTVTVRDRDGLCAAHITEFKGRDIGQHIDKPLRTITTSWGEFAECQTVLKKVGSDSELGYWPQIRILLNEYCGYNLAEDEVILLIIGGMTYFISDITLRMLTPRELYNAMGFPYDYIIDHDYNGNIYPKDKQVARCGNAVCPPMAEAVVRANFPEWCGKKLLTLEDFNNTVAS